MRKIVTKNYQVKLFVKRFNRMTVFIIRLLALQNFVYQISFFKIILFLTLCENLPLFIKTGIRKLGVAFIFINYLLIQQCRLRISSIMHGYCWSMHDFKYPILGTSEKTHIKYNRENRFDSFGVHRDQ